MSYQQHWKALVALFAKCGVITSKATHLFHGASARELHAKGSASTGMPPCRAAHTRLAGRHAIKPSTACFMLRTYSRLSPCYVLCRVSFEDIEILGHWCGKHMSRAI